MLYKKSVLAHLRQNEKLKKTFKCLILSQNQQEFNAVALEVFFAEEEDTLIILILVGMAIIIVAPVK